MEVDKYAKGLVAAASEYKLNPCNMHLVQLQRQIDVMTGVSQKEVSTRYFHPKGLLASECLVALVDILNDPQTKQELAHKTMTLLSCLAKRPAVRDALHSMYYLTPCLASYINAQIVSTEDPMLLQSVQLLYRITYNCVISQNETYVESLVKMLHSHIISRESDLTQPCLGVLANICRRNDHVQNCLKNILKDSKKRFYSKLMDYIGHSVPSVPMCSLTLLSSLSLNEDFGQKVFTRNLGCILRVMFKNILHIDSHTTRRYTVDLFKDLLRNPHIQHAVTKYDQLRTTLKAVVAMLSQSDEEKVAQIFELLLSFCGVNGLRCVVCGTLFESKSLQDPSYRELTSPTSEPFLAMVHWAGQSVDTHDSAPLLALDLLRDIYQELLATGLDASLSPRTDLVLPMVSEILMAPVTKDTKYVKKHCLKIVKALQLLITLCSAPSLRSDVAAAVDVATCTNLIDYQLTHNLLIRNPQLHTTDPDHWSEAGCDVILHTLILMTVVRQEAGKLYSSLKKLLKDERIMPYLAYGLTSTERDRVQMAMTLVAEGTQNSGFPASQLGDSIAVYNTVRPGLVDHSDPPTEARKRPRLASLDDKENRLEAAGYHGNTTNLSNGSAGSNTSNRSNTSYFSNKSDTKTIEREVSIETLIERMKSGMDLKDSRSLDLINVYEHKLQSLQTKENHLQDLLEAKALALSQADRLIAQYRSRLAQTEAEAHKLRSMFSEWERRTDENREQINELLLERERMANDNEQMAQDNARLEVVVSEHEKLVTLHNEQSQVLENTQRSLVALRQEHQTMSEMHEMLRRHNEALKQQHDTASQQLVELEDERKSLSKQLKEKESQCNDTSKALARSEGKLKIVTKERDDLEGAIDNLRSELERIEKRKKELQQQVASQELLLQQHEAAIKEKDGVIRNQKVQIDKTSQITAMIQQLSSSVVPEGVNL